MSKPKLLIADGISINGERILRNHSDLFDLEIGLSLKEEALLEKIGSVEALGVRSSTPVTKKILERAEKLSLIGMAGVGVDHIDLEEARKKKIHVIRTANANAVTTAELAIALLLSLVRNLFQAQKSTAAGEWRRKDFLGMELAHKTLGIIGLGTIGKILAKKMSLGFEMNIVAYDPFIENTVERVKMVHLESLLETSDIISLHLPLYEETRGFISKEKLSQMKKGSFLVNAARGGLVVESDILESLSQNHLAGYATDVFEEEPPAADHPFFKNPKIIFTPHLGAQTKEAQARVGVDLATQFVEYFKSGQIRNEVVDWSQKWKDLQKKVSR